MTTEADYLTLADKFLGDTLGAGVLECRRKSDNNLMRFDQATQQFGILFADNHIRTFYVLTPGTRDPRWFQKRCQE